MSLTQLTELLEPISRLVPSLDAGDPKAAEARLNQEFPGDSERVLQIREAAMAAVEAGVLCHKGAPGMQFSRLSKPEATTGGCSIDAVLMENSAGPAHTHTLGEFCLCLPLTEGATFEDRSDVWIVMPTGSRHVPEVKLGRMLILYWLPEGAVSWD